MKRYKSVFKEKVITVQEVEQDLEKLGFKKDKDFTIDEYHKMPVILPKGNTNFHLIQRKLQGIYNLVNNGNNLIVKS